MMLERHVLRLDLDYVGFMHNSFKKRFAKAIEALKGDIYSRSLTSIYNELVNAIGDSVILNQSKSEIYQYVFYASQFGINHFKLASHDGEPMVLTIGETPVNGVGKKTRDYIDFGSWMRVFMLSMIVRDKDAIQFLVGIENEFMKQGVISYDDLRIAEVNLMKSMETGSGDIQNAIQAYWDAEKNLSPKDPSRDWVDNSSVPMVKVIGAAANKDQLLFDKELEDALITHKTYFGKESAQSSSWGWISFPLLMACAYAYDRGMKINVESDYIPRWLAEGDFKDCELTVK